MLKKCSKCAAEKPLTTEFFYRKSCNKSGFRAECKDCTEAWKRINADRQRVIKLRSYHRRKAANPEIIKQNWRRQDKRRRSDPKRVLSNRIGVALRSVLKGKDGQSWQDLLGYSADDLKAHIERQFLPGMNWSNIRDWHIDHIVPVSSFEFDSLDDPELRACFALSNLRPMWARENMSKNASREYLV